MTQTLVELFPELETEAWQVEREECWQLALEKGEWKSEYRKKDLEKIRHYFFNGEISESFPIKLNSRLLLLIFPVQTKAGYDYYYQTHVFTEKQMESNISSAFLDQESHGMRWQEQKAYFDYHVGQVFKPEITIMVSGKEVTTYINSTSKFNSLVSNFSTFLRKGLGRPVEKLLYFVPYFASLVLYMEPNGNELSKIDSPVLPKLINRVKMGDFGFKKEETVPYQKQLIEDLLPIVERIEEKLK